MKWFMDAPFQLGVLSIMDSNPHYPSPTHSHRHFKVTHTNIVPHISTPTGYRKGGEGYLHNWPEFTLFQFPLLTCKCTLQKNLHMDARENIFSTFFLESKVDQPCPLCSPSVCIHSAVSLSWPDPPCPPPYPKTIRWGPLLPQTWRNMCFIFRAHSLGPR